jgi:hypothetical protein
LILLWIRLIGLRGITPTLLGKPLRILELLWSRLVLLRHRLAGHSPLGIDDARSIGSHLLRIIAAGRSRRPLLRSIIVHGGLRGLRRPLLLLLLLRLGAAPIRVELVSRITCPPRPHIPDRGIVYSVSARRPAKEVVQESVTGSCSDQQAQ